MQLSKNFTLNEFACKCTKCQANIGGTTINMRLVNAVQAYRDLVNKPVEILSGYRCPEYNKAIGGVGHSEHTTGEAVDLRVRGLSLKAQYEAALKIDALNKSGIGVYPSEGFIHVDVNRTKPARWARVEGEYVGINVGLALLPTKAKGKV